MRTAGHAVGNPSLPSAAPAHSVHQGVCSNGQRVETMEFRAFYAVEVASACCRTGRCVDQVWLLEAKLTTCITVQQ
jgi:hypothetical protein